MYGRWIAVGAVVLVAGCVSLWEPAEGRAEHQRADHTVRVAEVERAPSHRTVVLHAVTRSVERGDLGFSGGGRVRSVEVSVGQRVSKGDVLARMDGAGYRNAEAAARGTVENLRNQVEQLGRDRTRLETLQQGTSVSEAELDRVVSQHQGAMAGLDAAEAQAAEARRQRRETVLVAPYDGVVTAVGARAGTVVAAGQPVVSVSGRDTLEIEVGLPESVWGSVDPTADVLVEFPGVGLHRSANMTTVGQAAGPTGLFPATIRLDADGLAPGLSARVSVPVPVDEVFAVAMQTVVDPTGHDPAVFVVEGGVATRVPVSVGVLVDGRVSVDGALEPGAFAVSAGLVGLLDGDKVVVLP